MNFHKNLAENIIVCSKIINLGLDLIKEHFFLLKKSYSHEIGKDQMSINYLVGKIRLKCSNQRVIFILFILQLSQNIIK